MILAVGVAALVLAVVGSVFFAALHVRDETQAAVDKRDAGGPGAGRDAP